MKNFYTRSLKALIIGLIFVSFSACTVEPQYIYCEDASITVYNNTNRVVFFSWHDNYCDEFLLPGESYTYFLGEVESNLSRPNTKLFDYTFDYRGFSDYTASISIDDCHKDFIIY